MFIWSGGVYSLHGFLEVLSSFAYYYGPKGDMFKVYFDYPPIYCASFVSVWYIHPSLRTEPLNDFVDQ